MKIYIAGPITNNPGYEKQFAEAEEKLLSMGHLVINPAKNPGTCYKDYLDIGLLELMKCDAIYLLPGWEKSKGAQLEALTGAAWRGGMNFVRTNHKEEADRHSE